MYVCNYRIKMMKLVTAFLLGLWLYFGTFLRASPTFAAVTAPQTRDQVETVDSKNSVIELALHNFPQNNCPEIISDCSPPKHGMHGMHRMHGMPEMQGMHEMHGMAGERRNTEFKNRQVLIKVQQFLVSIPSDYYNVKNIDTLKTLVKEKQALLVDVREPREYASGHIKGAINIALRELTQNLNQIPTNRPVILYCSTGYRTAMGVMALQMLGYNNVKGFASSIEGWKAAGEPLE